MEKEKKLDAVSLSRVNLNSRVFKTQIALVDISSNELLKSARTFSDKIFVFKDKSLSAENKVDFSEYNIKNNKIDVWIHIENKEILSIYDKNQILYCFPKYKFINGRLFFIKLLIDDMVQQNYFPLYEIKSHA